jgi:hypothetical protein
MPIKPTPNKRNVAGSGITEESGIGLSVGSRVGSSGLYRFYTKILL